MVSATYSGRAGLMGPGIGGGVLVPCLGTLSREWQVGPGRGHAEVRRALRRVLESEVVDLSLDAMLEQCGGVAEDELGLAVDFQGD